MTAALIIALVVVYVLALLRFVVVCVAAARLPEPARHRQPLPSPLPLVALQIATYREAPALPGLLEAILRLDWPRDRLIVQIVDDSSGEDAAASRAVAARFSASGVRVDYLNRGSRAGFKAGALNYALAAARDADLIAYFDADCRPRPAFLSCLVPRFGDDRVAAVQARWEYPNAELTPLTMIQQAAFEYLFRYEYGLRAALGSPVYYLGSAAVWRRQALEDLGGWRTHPFTAEDVDMGCRARAAGWQVLYEPAALADDDAVEEMLAFRAQQRRWAHAVTRAGLDARSGLLRAPWGWRALLLDVTAFLPHATIVLTLIVTLVLVAHLLVGAERSAAVNAAEWTFAAAVGASPAVLALVLAMRHFHAGRWRRQAALFLQGGFAAAATMTSFLFGLSDLGREGRLEFVATPKSGQVAVLGESRDRWLRRLYAPVAFDAAVTAFLSIGLVVAVARQAVNVAVPALLIGAAYGASCARSVAAIRRHRARLSRPAIVAAAR
jgi:cellulose synthase/poly-beta-1,6-N-acetylglucosamine synthase-like glycosyltransferase